jgi:antitoxin YefM
MEIISYTKARSQLADVMNKVCDDHIPIVINRQEQRPVIVMSLEDYNAIEETLYLLGNNKNAKKLNEALEDFNLNKNFFELKI